MRLSRLFNVYVLLVVIVVGGLIFSPPFRSWQTISSVLTNSAPLILAAVGQLFAMVVWGIDLSLGSIMNVVVVAGSFLVVGAAWQVALGLAACVLLGAFLGLINGLLITRLKLPDFVVTLGTFIVYQGIALTIRPTPGGSINSNVLMFSYGSTLGLPNTTWLLIALVAVLAYVLRATRLGQYMIAVGSNRENSYLLGLPVERVRVAAYVMSGTCAGIGALFLLGQIGTGAANAANSYQLDSIIATVVGGTSLYGGVGSVLGTVFGGLILQSALKLLTLANLLGSYVQVFEGTVVVVVVALVSLTRYQRHAARVAADNE